MKRLPLWCSVPAGVLAAHALGYLIAYPNPAQRAAALASSGHTYLRHAAMIAVIAAAIGVSTSIAGGLRDVKRTRWWDTALRISVVQMLAFFAVEVLERIAAGVQPTAGFAHILLVGTLLQVLMAAFVAVVLVAFERAGRTVAAVARAELRPRTSHVTRLEGTPDEAPIAKLFCSVRSARSPPPLLATT